MSQAEKDLIASMEAHGVHLDAGLRLLKARFDRMAEARKQTALWKRAQGHESDYAPICGLEAAADAYARCAREVERVLFGEKPAPPGHEWTE